MAGASRRMRSGPSAALRPSRGTPRSPKARSGSAAAAQMAALSRNGVHPAIPANDSSNSPLPKPSESAAADVDDARARHRSPIG